MLYSKYNKEPPERVYVIIKTPIVRQSELFQGLLRPVRFGDPGIR